MNTTQSYRARYPTALAVFEAHPEVAEDIVSRPDDQDSVDYVFELLKSATPEEAITFCAYLLSIREAVWMGHECLIHISKNLSEKDLELLRLVEDWVRQPDDDRRVAALDAGMECEPKGPGAWIALAAGWSGGSMVGPEHPIVPPGPSLTPRAVNAGVLSALARLDSAVRDKALKDFVEIGLTIIEDSDG